MGMGTGMVVGWGPGGGAVSGNKYDVEPLAVTRMNKSKHVGR